jgi:hypothetical protein
MRRVVYYGSILLLAWGVIHVHGCMARETWRQYEVETDPYHRLPEPEPVPIRPGHNSTSAPSVENVSGADRLSYSAAIQSSLRTPTRQ